MQKMEKLKDCQVWSQNTKTWTWECEEYYETTMVEAGFDEKLLILLVIVCVILILIFVLAIQISCSYFSRKSVDTGTHTEADTDTDKQQTSSRVPSKSLNLPTESPSAYSDVVLNIDLNRKEDPPAYSQLFS